VEQRDLGRSRTTFAKGKPHRFKPGVVSNPKGRPKVVDDIHALAREHAPAAIARLLQLMHQNDDLGVAIAATNSLLDRGYGRPPQAVLAQVNGTLAVSGIDAPPPIINETNEEWLARRRAELAALEADSASRRSPEPAAAAPEPRNGSADFSEPRCCAAPMYAPPAPAPAAAPTPTRRAP